MLVQDAVSATTLIERGCLEVNPVVKFETRDDTKKHIEAKIKDGGFYTYHLPYGLYRSSIDLLGYLTIHPTDALSFMPYSKDKEATKLTKLRLYCLVEATGDYQVIDLAYEENGDAHYMRYKLKKVTVYNEYNYAFVYNIVNILDANSRIQSIKLDLETLELTQTIVSRDGR